MPMELFDRRLAPLNKAPLVTIQRRGNFSFTHAAHELLGKPDAIELLYDREEHLIGIRPADPRSTTAFALRPAVADRPASPLVTTAASFTAFYDIDTSVSRRWTPELRDGLLLIDLKGPSVEARRGSSKETDDED